MPLIEPGRRAPDFSLQDQGGAVRTLGEHRGKYVVLYFYPEDDTPTCTAQACAFRDAWPEFGAVNAAMLGISPDTAESHARFAAGHRVPFTLLADPPARRGAAPRTCKAYGVWAEKVMFGNRYMGVVRTTYLIGPDGKVVRRWDRVRVPGHAAQVLKEIARATGESRGTGAGRVTGGRGGPGRG